VRRAWLILLVGCGSEPRSVDFPDVDLRLPGSMELESRLKAYRDGAERHHGDPCLVAHLALQDHIDNIPWRGRPYSPGDYELVERNPAHPDWGSYVVRGWSERGAPRVRRYRVKVRRYEEIWYAIQVSHYMLIDLPEHEESEMPPNASKW
jgi:hypothetical protein